MTGQNLYIALLRQLSTGPCTEADLPSYSLSMLSEVTLGRDPRCHVALDSLLYGMVSRRHALIRLISDFQAEYSSQVNYELPLWQICDLGSANGTYVNGQRLQGCHLLQMGDRIRLGHDGPEFTFEYQLSVVSPNAAPVLADPGTASSPLVASGSSTDAVTLTQLFPILSTGQELARKAYLLPGIVTVGFVVLMFVAVGDPLVFNALLATYIVGAAYYIVYQLCGKHKPWWVLLGAATATLLVLLSPLLDLFIEIFRHILPGRLPTEEESISWLARIVRMFFGAGLMEELLKALTVLAAYFIGQQLRSPWRERVGVWEPLDGILLGTASAAGFTLLETLGQYVPEIVEQSGPLEGLQLLIPRVLGSVAGHMAYSGYLGYFIGLSVLKPKKRWSILAIGYLTSAALHTLWNVAGRISLVLLVLIGALSYAFLAAAILKARRLSPTRSQNFATRFHQSP